MEYPDSRKPLEYLLEQKPEEAEVVEANEPNPRLATEFERGGSIGTSPLVADGIVYFADALKFFYACDAVTGRELWRFQAGDAVGSSPTIASGLVYFGCFNGFVYALQAATGELVWRFYTGDGVYSSPAVVDGVVYIGSYNGYLYALDAQTGKDIWKFKTGSLILSSPAVANDMVIFGSMDKYIYALNAKTGRLLWRHLTNGWVESSPTIADEQGNEIWAYGNHHRHTMPHIRDGTILVASYDGYLYALTLNGRLKWTFRTDDILIPSTVWRGRVFTASADSYVYALDMNGKLLWKFRTGEKNTKLIIRDGVLYAPSYNCYLHAIDPETGSLKWRFRTGGFIINVPEKAGNMLYFGSFDCFLYAITTDGELVWKFYTGSKPAIPTYHQHHLRLQNLLKRLFRWWKPEKPVSHAYETKQFVQTATGGVGPYKSSEPYKSEVKYDMSGPAAYQMGSQEKRRDWRDQLLGKR